jgi:hypothetical protein
VWVVGTFWICRIPAEVAKTTRGFGPIRFHKKKKREGQNNREQVFEQNRKKQVVATKDAGANVHPSTTR